MFTRKNKIRQRGKTRKLHIEFRNWWGTPTPEELKFFKRLVGNCGVPYEKVQVYAALSNTNNRANGMPLPKNQRSEKILRIQYSGEGSYGHLDKFDINIVPGDHPKSPSFLVNPFMHLYIERNGYPMKAFTAHRPYPGPKSKFCLFSVSNPKAPERIDFFHQLSKYKHVDSCGKELNNLGFNCPGPLGGPDHIKFVSDYKFSICFENTSMTNYMTEKLAIAYLAGTIPIYWGCANTEDYINMSAILYLKPQFTQADVQALIEKIKRLDANEALYTKMFMRPLFKGGVVPAAFDLKALNEKVCAYHYNRVPG